MSVGERRVVSVRMSLALVQGLRLTLIYALTNEHRARAAFPRARDRRWAEAALQHLTDEIGHTLPDAGAVIDLLPAEAGVRAASPSAPEDAA